MRLATQVSGDGTTLWAMRGGGTSADELRGVALDGAGGSVVAVGFFFSSPAATFGGAVLPWSGESDAVMWKVSTRPGRVRSLASFVRGGSTLLCLPLVVYEFGGGGWS